MEAEFGLPQWLFGMSTYAFESEQRLICAFARKGIWQLADIDLAAGQYKVIETPYTDIAYLRATADTAVFVGGTASQPASIIRLDLTSRVPEVLRRSSRVEIDAGFISNPQTIEFPTA
ncbi:MAG: hypothetical protein P8X90_26925, partial [Desulfobacterales bacterium]